MIRLIVISALGLWLVGCTNTVKPPGNVRDPVTIFLVDQGRTSSLVLPRENGKTVRFAYGSWNWYALDNTMPWDAVGALFLPLQGTLGRMEMDCPPDADRLRVRVHHIEFLYPLIVERKEVQKLEAELDQSFNDHSAVQVNNRDNDLIFVRHPSAYFCLHDSNHVVCNWLEQLGCEIHGSTLLSNWRITPINLQSPSNSR